ncbi:MAG: SAM-dependent methyltransferase [Desulfomonilaceae bacterium]
MKKGERIAGSFRDPSGFVFRCEGNILRQINFNYKEHYDLLMQLGLYTALVDSKLLIPHQELSNAYSQSNEAYMVIRPDPIPFITYPYEWSFSQLKSAALCALEVQKTALGFGMSLKDCSAYNVQFKAGKPVFIDTLSFEHYVEGDPWVAFRQFCQHYLAPLVLMSFKDIRLNQLFRIYIDGIPLDLASSLLPLRTWLSLSVFSLIHVHARAQKHFAGKMVKMSGRRMDQKNLLGLLDKLQDIVTNLSWEPQKSEWSDYYRSGCSQNSLEDKKKVIGRFLEIAAPETVWDLGGNIGVFSRISSDRKIMTVSFDSDPSAVESNYRQCIIENDEHLLPLLVDLTNPSPCLGWANNERMSLLERGPADLVMALALVHHLAISNNVPLKSIAEFLASIAKSLIIEFVPKSDERVKILLATRRDIFADYNEQTFEEAFGSFFRIVESVQIADSQRTLYLMKSMKTKS